MTGDRYLGISLALLRTYRAVLPRRTDVEGSTSWSAEVAGMPGLLASGATCTEALAGAQANLMSQRETLPGQHPALARMMTPTDQP